MLLRSSRERLQRMHRTDVDVDGGYRGGGNRGRGGRIEGGGGQKRGAKEGSEEGVNGGRCNGVCERVYQQLRLRLRLSVRNACIRKECINKSECINRGVSEGYVRGN